MLGTVLIVVLILALLGALPGWSHSRDWGYAPTGGVGVIILIVVVLVLLGLVILDGRALKRLRPSRA